MILLVVGARPNFIKSLPLITELKNNNINFKLINTGQHYDFNLCQNIFNKLNLPEPDINFNVGSDTHTKQTAKIMVEFENYCISLNTNIKLVVLIGDVNSTLACAITASKLNIPIAHIEAGFRVFDMSMPEEINRVVTDHLSTYLFSYSAEATSNLFKEGLEKRKKIYVVGDLLFDALTQISDLTTNIAVPKKEYCLLTMHRNLNTDNKDRLSSLLITLNNISQTKIDIIFPIHPRTKKKIKEFNLDSLINYEHFHIHSPFDYLKFNAYLKNSKFVITDSGGVQVESYLLNIPCITLRDETEHNYTLKNNQLVGTNEEKIVNAVDNILNNKIEKTKTIYENKSAIYIVEAIKKILGD